MRPRLVWAAVFTTAFILTLVVIVGPHDFAWSHGFMLGGSGATNVNGHPLALGDHLQGTYYMWLWWHGLLTGHLPFVDPFQFAMTGHHVLALAGWPLVLVFIPFTAIAGPVAAFNAVIVASFLATAVCTYLLARRLGVTSAGATIASLAFAFAPFRLIQAGHFGTYLGFFPPLILYLADRALRDERHNVRWAWGCVLAYISMIAGGELHIVLYSTAIFVTFVAVRCIGVPRERLRALLPVAVVLAVCSALALGVVYREILTPASKNPNAVNINLAPSYAPRIANLFHPRHGTEQYDYPGITIALLAFIAFIASLRSAKYRILALWLVALIAIAYIVAMAPAWGPAFRVFKQLPLSGFIRVPGRILLISSLAFALLAGIGVSVLEHKWSPWVVLPIVFVLVVADVHLAAGAFVYTTAGHDELASVPKDAAVMDLPPFPPFHHGSSRYMLDLTRHPGPRANGYDVLAPDVVWQEQAKTWPLAHLPVDPCVWKQLSSQMRFRYTAVHADLFGPPPFWPIAGQPPVTAAALVAALDTTPGFHRLSTVDATTVYRIAPAELRC